jgi:hypothetical protein
MYVEAWVSAMVDRQCLPFFVVSSPFYNPHVLVFIDDEAKVSFFR